MSKEAKRYSCGNGDGMFEDENGFYVEYSQPALFKVATEDSCVVLEKPIAYEEYLRYKLKSIKRTNNLVWNNCEAYDKAPSISKPELDLNKLRVQFKIREDSLNDLTIMNTNLIEINDKKDLEIFKMEREADVQSDILRKCLIINTEANKQLNEHKEVVGLYIDLENTFGLYKALDSEYNVMRINELLSKLNKD